MALAYERLYLEKLPSASMYERSYMHRDVVTHLSVARWVSTAVVLAGLVRPSPSPPLPCVLSTDFLITGSMDGHVKFWKKQETGIEFVKHFRAHLGKVADMATSSDGLLLCTVSDDKSMKVFDIVNFGELSSLLPLVCALVSCLVAAAISLCAMHGAVVYSAWWLSR